MNSHKYADGRWVKVESTKDNGARRNDQLALLARVVLLNVPFTNAKLPDGCTWENVQEAMAEGLCQ